MPRTKLTLTERATMTRQVAAEHRTLAANTLRIAEDLEAKAALMDQGIDPYADDN